ncbi:hypothetical protein QM027_04520 [Campylobacter concisus]
MAQIDALKLNELKAIIKDKFTNAASYTFVIIGDTDEQRLLPLVKKYIATLPKLGEAENFKDDGVRSIRGQHTFKREYQSTKRSDVSVDIGKFRYKIQLQRGGQAKSAKLGLKNGAS